MANFRLLNYRGEAGAARAAIARDDDRIVDLLEALPGCAWAASTLAVLGAWDEAQPRLARLAGESDAPTRALSEVRLLAPLLYPPAIYCTGANYQAHASEMNAEGAWTRPRPSRTCSSSPARTA